MARMSGEVLVDAPVETVFDLVADERNEPRYNPRIARAEKLDGGPVGTGSRFAAYPKGMGERGRMLLEIREYDRPHRLHNVVRSSFLEVDGWLTFDQVGARTRLRWDWGMRLLGPSRLLAPVLALVGPRWERRNWVDLQRYVRAGGR